MIECAGDDIRYIYIAMKIIVNEMGIDTAYLENE